MPAKLKTYMVSIEYAPRLELIHAKDRQDAFNRAEQLFMVNDPNRQNISNWHVKEVVK